MSGSFRAVAVFLKSVAICWIATSVTAASDSSNDQRQTGWRLERFDERDVLIRPDGDPAFLLGLNHCGAEMPKGATDRHQYLVTVDKTLRTLGFNNLGYGAPKELFDRWPFIAGQSYHGASHARDVDSFGYDDVFDASFQKQLREKIRKSCDAYRDNPNLIGFYWTDTPRWDIGISRRLRGDDWVSAMRRLPPTAAGKQAYVDFLRRRYRTVDKFTSAYGHEIAAFEDLLLYDFREFDRDSTAGLTDDRLFVGEIATTLYRVMGETFKEHAPNALIFGERYKLHDHPDIVLEAARKWIDVLSIQPGPSVGPRPGPGDDERRFDTNLFDRLHHLTRKPILICDHKISFPTKVHPTTLWHQAGSEREALEITAEFIQAAVDRPYVIGFQNCQYRDSFRPERGNMLKQGIMRADGSAYQLSHQRLTELNQETQSYWRSLLGDRPPDAGAKKKRQ